MECYQRKKKRFQLRGADAATSASLEETDAHPHDSVVTTYIYASTELIHLVESHFGGIGATEEVLRLLLEWELGILPLERTDLWYGRAFILSHYIRLGQDHVAFNHMKWRNLGMRNMPLRVYDMFESPDGWWDPENVDIIQASALALIKVRLLLDLQAIQNAARGLGGDGFGKLPREILDLIRWKLTNSSLLEVRPQLLSASKDDVFALIQMLKGHIRTLFRLMVDHTYFFPLPLGSRAGLMKDRGPTGRACHYAWVESPGAMDVAAAVAEAIEGETEVPVRED